MAAKHDPGPSGGILVWLMARKHHILWTFRESLVLKNSLPTSVGCVEETWLEGWVGIPCLVAPGWIHQNRTRTQQAPMATGEGRHAQTGSLPCSLQELLFQVLAQRCYCLRICQSDCTEICSSRRGSKSEEDWRGSWTIRARQPFALFHGERGTSIFNAQGGGAQDLLPQWSFRLWAKAEKGWQKGLKVAGWWDFQERQRCTCAHAHCVCSEHHSVPASPSATKEGVWGWLTAAEAFKTHYKQPKWAANYPPRQNDLLIPYLF